MVRAFITDTATRPFSHSNKGLHESVPEVLAEELLSKGGYFEKYLPYLHSFFSFFLGAVRAKYAAKDSMCT